MQSRIMAITGLFQILGFILSSVCFVPASHAAFFQGLGDLPGGDYWTEVRGVAAEGYGIVGASKSYADDRDAFRWLPSSGIQRLGDLPAHAYHPQPAGASANGEMVVGYMAFSTNPTSTGGYYWTQNSGFNLLPSLNDRLFVYANGVSGDGTVIVGTEEFHGTGEAIRWSVGSDVTVMSLGFLPGGSDSRGLAVSSDGSVTVGYGYVPQGQEAFRCIDSQPMESLGDLSGGQVKSAAYAVSQNGSVIVGFGTTDSGSQAFRWTEETGMISLGSNTVSARSTSADGSVIVGIGNNDFSAFIWDANYGVRSVADLLADAGVDMSGWSLTSALGVSSDGKMLTGQGINPNGEFEGWVAIIPEPATALLFTLAGPLAVMRRRP